MEFCDCGSLMRKTTTGTDIIYHCYCGYTQAGSADDTLMDEGQLEATESLMRHEILIQNSAFDPAGKRVMQRCPKCQKSIMSIAQVGINETIFLTCTCGYYADLKKYKKDSKDEIKSLTSSKTGGSDEIQVNYRTFPSEKKLHTMYRILPDNMPELKYHSHKFTHIINCHWGQRKLFYSEFELFSIMLRKGHNLADYAVLYVGAAEGSHIKILDKYFPELTWLLWDPAPFKLPKMDNVHIYNDFFTDESIKISLEKAKGKKIIFISDIRIEPKEDRVESDMLDQQKWAIDSNAKFMLLKFRLPYSKDDSEKPQLFKYLKGDVFLQLYAPTHSTETRLLVEQGEDGKYTFQDYDYGKYERQMLYYNEVRRIQKYSINGSTEMKHHILGFDDSHESVSEYQIIANYLDDSNPAKVIPILREIDVAFNQMYELSKASLLLCQARTLAKRRGKKDYQLFVKKFKSDRRITNSIIEQQRLFQKYIDNPDEYITYLPIAEYKQMIKEGEIRKVEFNKLIKKL